MNWPRFIMSLAFLLFPFAIWFLMREKRKEHRRDKRKMRDWAAQAREEQRKFYEVEKKLTEEFEKTVDAIARDSEK